MGSVMKMVGAVAVAMTLFIGTASAEDLTAASARAIVERQFDAFERDDGEAAYALAAPTIKQMFDDAAITSWRWFAATMRLSTGTAAPSLAPLRKKATRRASRRLWSTTMTSCGRRSTAFGVCRTVTG